MSGRTRVIGLVMAALAAGEALRATDVREEGVFRIFLAGAEIGSERFQIVASADSVQSSSAVEFRLPAPERGKVMLNSKLSMDNSYRPRKYELKMEVGDQKGIITGSFNAGEAMFEYRSTAGSQKSGVLAGEKCTMLDTNVFHHFIFLARLFDFGSPDSEQQFEVVIPQERDAGKLKVKLAGTETIGAAGRRIETRHLKLDSGELAVDLWIDGSRTVQKIAVPERKIEVLRSSVKAR